MLKNFEILPVHLQLMKRIYFGFNAHCEFGATEVNPKRPYGNSDVYSDICEIIDFKPKNENNLSIEDYGLCEMLTKEEEKYLYKIHKEMEVVLQIVCCTQQISIGKYEKKSEYERLSWEKINTDINNEVV